MKKLLSVMAVLAVFTSLSAYAAENSLASFFDTLSKKEQEFTNILLERQKAREAKQAELEKQQAEQKAALEAKQAELKKQQEANRKALEQAKKDAEARQEARNKAIEAEKNYWKGLIQQ